MDGYNRMPHESFFNRKEKVSRKEIRQYLMPYFFNKESMPIFYNSMFLLVGAKGLAVASPYILKKIVDAMTLVGTIDFQTAAGGILLFGAIRSISTIL